MEQKQSNTNNNKKPGKCTADWLLPIVGASGLSCPQEDINVGANIYFPNLHNSIISHWTMKQHCKQSKATGTGQATATTKAPGRLPALPWSVCSHCPSVWVLPPTFPDSVVLLLAYPLCHYPCQDAYWCFCWCCWNGETGNSISPPVTSGNEDLCRRIFSVHPYTSWYPILLSSSTGTVPLDSHNTEMD